MWHRRSGKDFTCWMHIVEQAIKTPGVYYYCLPTYRQGKKAIWDAIANDGKKFLDYIPKGFIEGNPNQTEMKIRFTTGSILQVVGGDDPDSLRGTNPRGVVLSEFSRMNPAIWDNILRPILAANHGWVVFNSTPNGRNHFKDLYDMAHAHPEAWYTSRLTVDDTHVVSQYVIEQDIREGMSEDMALQEYMCSFNAGTEGAYYAKLMEQARNEARIGHVPYDRSVPVYTAWDLGYGDATSIIFFQLIGSEVRVIDYYEASGEGMEHYASALDDRPYRYAKHYAPHDVEAGSLQSGVSLKQVAKGLGIDFVTLPRAAFSYGIEQARITLPFCYFDEVKCKRLIKCLDGYQKKYNKAMEMYLDEPLHNQLSHGCFTADTLVTTTKGRKRIDSIQVGDEVVTPFGQRKVQKVFCYSSLTMVDVETSREKFTCTPEHHIFSNLGLVYADALRYNTYVFHEEDIWAEWEEMGPTTSLMGFRDFFLQMRNLSYGRDISIDGMEGITGVIPAGVIPIKVSIEQSMLDWLDQYLWDTMCTMSPEILKITDLVIFSLCRLPSTASCTDRPAQGLAKRLLDSLSQWRQLGMQTKKDGSGTRNMRRDSGSALLDIIENIVISAERSSCALTPGTDSAPINVKQGSDSLAESTTNGACAASAGLSFPLIDMCPRERVVRAVGRALEKPIKVYDLCVETDHCYYANGILVSNSDAFRYLSCARAQIKNSTNIDPQDFNQRRMAALYGAQSNLPPMFQQPYPGMR